MNGDYLRKIVCFASKYDRMLVQERQRLGLQRWSGLRNDWWIGLQFFFNRAFFQGRRDAVSQAFREATGAALASLIPSEICSDARAARILAWSKEGWFQKDRWADGKNPVRQALDRQYNIEIAGRQRSFNTGKERDREMVLDTLGFICGSATAEGQTLNITAYAAERIEAGETAAVYKELDGIRQVGPKIASLFLRDLVVVLGLQRKLTQDDYCLLQPVDTWVEQVAHKLRVQADPRDLPAVLVKTCQREGVDPIRFNQGAWYLGARSFDVILENLERIEP